MSTLSNNFSLLDLDAEDDTTQISTQADVKNESDKVKRKGALSGEKEILKVDENLQKNNLTHSEEYRMPLVWIDLEMTGLDVGVDRILEIACVITDGKLTKSVEGPDLVIKQSKECLDNMGDWCREHHGASGLTKKVLQSTITEKDAEKQVKDFLMEHIGSHKPLLAGNSVYVDLIFLKKYMPDLADFFHHVVVDVSTINALCARWFPNDKKRAPKKEKNHRAMDDIKESIKELKYYKSNIFKSK